MIRAALLMLLAMSLIPLGDTAGKLLITRHGVSPWFVAWSRFAIGALAMLPFLGSTFRPRLMADGRIWLRGMLIVGGICAILTALSTEPLPNVFGAFFIGPVISYGLSVWLLKERPEAARIALLGLGFLGVLMVVKPGFGMTPGLGFAVLAGCFYGAFLTASRWLAGVARPRGLLFSQLLVGALVLAPAGLSHLPQATAPVAALALLSALASMAGNLLLVVVYRMAPATRMAPFVYFQLVAATGLGLAVFGDLPDAVALAGLALLVASGLAGLWPRLTPTPPAPGSR
ncbi:EamA-like transporter family protein [Pseudoruegeria aquimaris]|uniref:EamA-like transporter family protein n=1 Tax=Pseudoruegeria aquimaris TaxID=393663 RepID=A0A1Y5RFX2_9RHOB|nr:DMT family transporter [Pseudoruegeria aquimaris]SLN16570.1 EamA-like transporter family protein [Pseudoruegeria aquimaris]